MAQLTLRRGEGGVLDQPYEMHCTVDFVVHIYVVLYLWDTVKINMGQNFKRFLTHFTAAYTCSLIAIG